MRVAIRRSLALLGLLIATFGMTPPAHAAPEVDLYGTVVSLQATILTVNVDGIRLALDVSEIDPRFLESLRPGDDVHVAAFRRPDGGLLVYSIFRQAPGERGEGRPAEPQGGSD